MRSKLVVLLIRRCLSACSLLAALCGPVFAQMSLPGATAPADVGTVVVPEAKPHKARPRAPRLAPSLAATSASLDGKTYALDGGKSQITFSAHDATVDVTHFVLVGTKISTGHDVCQVDVVGTPLHLGRLGLVDGLFRLSVPLPACPINLDLLDGAVLASTDGSTCTFKEADCSVPVGGMWGPMAGDLGPDQVKTIEHERSQAEKAVREAYKSLVSSTKDRAIIRGVASDQAGFSSHREELCRDYIGESRHGFCNTRLTQARAAALAAKLVVADAVKGARHKRSSGGARE